MKPRLDEAFTSAAKVNKVPGIAAVAMNKSGEVLFKGAYGNTNASDSSDSAEMTADTPMLLFSCTKIFTSVAALQLVEQGKLNLEDLVEKYVPSMANMQVLEGFDDDGKPQLRPTKTKATILQLMTHTTGFTYDFFNPETTRYTQATGGQLSTYGAVGSRECFNTPLAFDPGARFEYGMNTDWLGFVVEAISNMSLDQYISKHITEPLGLKNTSAHVPNGVAQLYVHHRGEDGSLTANPGLQNAKSPEKYGGGHYLYSTLNDFSTFLLTILNNGIHPGSGVRILSEKSVKEYLFTDQIQNVCSSTRIGAIHTANPILSNNGELLPGLEKGWSCGFMLNPEGSPKGRSAMSGSWAGLANLYYFLDPIKGMFGLTMSSVLPFLDAEVCHLHDELERAMYGHDSAQEIGEFGGNWGVTKG